MRILEQGFGPAFSLPLQRVTEARLKILEFDRNLLFLHCYLAS
jgi:hypothetical protein